MATGRRLRGVLLRLVLNRRAAIALGALLIAPAVWLFSVDTKWESGLTDGFSLLVFATGIALVWTALVGRQPDWLDPERNDSRGL